MEKVLFMSLQLVMEENLIPVQLMAMLTVYTPFLWALQLAMEHSLVLMKSVLPRWWLHSTVILIEKKTKEML